MTLIQLEYIIALDRYRHFGKAADFCNIAQPSLSLQIQKLEDELKTTIFSRSTPITPTETGIIIIDQAKKIMAEVGMVQELIQQQKNIVTGVLRIGILPTLAPYLLPLFLQPFIKAHPDVRICINELTTGKIIEQLKNGTMDLGIMATPLLVEELNEDVLFNEEFVAYVSRKEKIFEKKYLLPSDIDVNSMWLLEEGHCLRTQALNLCQLRKDTLIQKNLDFETGSIETLKRFVERNGGITLLPELATIDMSLSRRGMLRYFKAPAPVREISMVSLKGFVKKRLAGILKECILSNLPQEVLFKREITRIALN